MVASGRGKKQMFFFEKKNQKTFAPWRTPCVTTRHCVCQLQRWTGRCVGVAHCGARSPSAARNIGQTTEQRDIFHTLTVYECAMILYQNDIAA
jgi:hypothetical protein